MHRPKIAATFPEIDHRRTASCLDEHKESFFPGDTTLILRRAFTGLSRADGRATCNQGMGERRSTVVGEYRGSRTVQPEILRTQDATRRFWRPGTGSVTGMVGPQIFGLPLGETLPGNERATMMPQVMISAIPTQDKDVGKVSKNR